MVFFFIALFAYRPGEKLVIDNATFIGIIHPAEQACMEVEEWGNAVIIGIQPWAQHLHENFQCGIMAQAGRYPFMVDICCGFGCHSPNGFVLPVSPRERFIYIKAWETYLLLVLLIEASRIARNSRTSNAEAHACICTTIFPASSLAGCLAGSHYIHIHIGIYSCFIPDHSYKNFARIPISQESSAL